MEPPRKRRPPLGLCSHGIDVRNEFQQRSIGIAKIDAVSGSARSCAWHRTELNQHSLTLQMCLGLTDRPRPDETEIAATWRNRQTGDRVGLDTWTMHVELDRAEAIDPSLFHGHNLCLNHLTIKGV